MSSTDPERNLNDWPIWRIGETADRILAKLEQQTPTTEYERELKKKRVKIYRFASRREHRQSHLAPYYPEDYHQYYLQKRGGQVKVDPLPITIPIAGKTEFSPELGSVEPRKFDPVFAERMRQEDKMIRALTWLLDRCDWQEDEYGKLGTYITDIYCDNKFNKYIGLPLVELVKQKDSENLEIHLAAWLIDEGEETKFPPLKLNSHNHKHVAWVIEACEKNWLMVPTSTLAYAWEVAAWTKDAINVKIADGNPKVISRCKGETDVNRNWERHCCHKCFRAQQCTDMVLDSDGWRICLLCAGMTKRQATKAELLAREQQAMRRRPTVDGTGWERVTERPNARLPISRFLCPAGEQRKEAQLLDWTCHQGVFGASAKWVTALPAAIGTVAAAKMHSARRREMEYEESDELRRL